MSWPSDGEPRFKVVEIRGGLIHQNRMPEDKVLSGGSEFCVLDRAACHRVVRRIVVTTTPFARRAGRDAIERMAERLNSAVSP